MHVQARPAAVAGDVDRPAAAAGVTEDELKALEKEIRQIVQEAADFAEQAPEPELAELYTDVLVGQY